MSNGKISEEDPYNLMGKDILRNAIGILPYEDIAKLEIDVKGQEGSLGDGQKLLQYNKARG